MLLHISVEHLPPPRRRQFTSLPRDTSWFLFDSRSGQNWGTVLSHWTLVPLWPTSDRAFTRTCRLISHILAHDLCISSCSSVDLLHQSSNSTWTIRALTLLGSRCVRRTYHALPCVSPTAFPPRPCRAHISKHLDPGTHRYKVTPSQHLLS